MFGWCNGVFNICQVLGDSGIMLFKWLWVVNSSLLLVLCFVVCEIICLFVSVLVWKLNSWCVVVGEFFCLFCG